MISILRYFVHVLAKGSKLAITFYLPLELLDEVDKPIHELGEKGARAAGTPFVSFFAPDERWALANDSGLKEVKTLSTKEMEGLYFTGRSDNLLPANGEVFLLAKT